MMDIEPSLQASFMSGLIEVGGSAKYLNDEQKFKNHSRVTLQYKATTNFKQLSIDQVTLGAEQMKIIEKGLATHVVTGILYGANAFFVFDSEKLEATQVQKIEGSMQALIKKIPSFDVKGKVDIKLTHEEKALTEKFSCKFYGDFILKSNPATFCAAVQRYVDLPQLLGKDGENSVPVKIWLMPLKSFYPKAPELMTGISIGLVRKAQGALEALKEVEMRSNHSLDDKEGEDFPKIRKDLSTFQKLCGYYKTNIQQAMAKKLPSIRAGKEDESSLEKIFEDRHKSPFSHEELNKWLDHKEREINIIGSCVDTMEGVKIVQNQTEVDKEVLAPGVEDVLCFVFTSMPRGDSYLDEMADYFKSTKLGSTHEDKWYYSKEVLKKMREKATFFQGASKALKHNSKFRFLITAKTDPIYKGASIYHYKKGKHVNKDFHPQKPSSVETITDKRDLIWYAYHSLKAYHANEKATFIIDLTISLMNGSSQTLRVRPHDTVGSLKILIQKLGFSCESQKLVFENGCSTTLNNDSATLESYGLHSGARVNLLVTTPAIIQVFLKNEKGVNSTYDIKPDETVSHFRSRVEERERVPVSEQRLLHESREMNEGKLSDYNVRANSTIFQTLRLRGG
ncbi:hypothetical protein JOQ06_011683 [Pogonophryne albipinna]|uniref:Ubiquitin-like domain-containing protein n=1 Tax=Pogonophryne albipinna TaxID=1090488 RepID=A0AAD6BGR5_9TELE|nr:hypothetical protein JOQ06_011683 [Pogonophryne albipinna]